MNHNSISQYIKISHDLSMVIVLPGGTKVLRGTMFVKARVTTSWRVQLGQSLLDTHQPLDLPCTAS